MAVPIIIPRLGWNMEEGIFSGWLKHDGDSVTVGEPIFRLEGDKAVQDIEALEAGVLRIPAGGPNEGETVAVGTTIAYLVASGEALPETKAAVPKLATQPAGPAARRLARTPAAEQVRGVGAMSPRARRVARELGIDESKLKGSGRTGRIRERDVRAAASSAGAGVLAGPVRKLIAEQVLRGAHSTAPVTLTTTVDATNLVSLRTQFLAAAGAAPSYTDMLVKLAALTLREHPQLNARWENDRIVPSTAIHIGIAVDAQHGLVAPVLRDVHELGLRQIATKTADLIKRAKSRALRAEEMKGGTFTITNLGMFGIDAFTPIINYPECAILGVGRIGKQPAVVDNQVLPRDMLTLSLTFDHRLVDGAPAARFLQALGQRVENPGPSLIST
jgi:pyruvate dehydrogenase E2 component (dihydrolipoamide acetyltransferase)